MNLYDGFNFQFVFSFTQPSNQDGDPVRPGVAMTDLATGLYAYGAIMTGLIQRYKTGKGLFIDCNLLSSQVPIQITFQIMKEKHISVLYVFISNPVVMCKNKKQNKRNCSSSPKKPNNSKSCSVFVSLML